MTITAKIIVDSVAPTGKRITTLQLKYPRFIHSEFMTHRQFSRNASSSRAIPVKKMIQNIIDDPAMPIHWGKNIPGMKAKEECMKSVVFPCDDTKNCFYIEYGHGSHGVPYTLGSARYAWLRARDLAVTMARAFDDAGYHKQVVNRLLEPFQHIEVICTATEWNNFFHLRDHEDAQPQIQELARQIKQAMVDSVPEPLNQGEWHLPYITEQDWNNVQFKLSSRQEAIWLMKKVSAARCCRVSYLKHDGTSPSIEDDLALYDKLVTSKPVHASPTEHQATPDWQHKDKWMNKDFHGNFVGWVQYRQLIKENYVSG